jgi:hypothetical protein
MQPANFTGEQHNHEALGTKVNVLVTLQQIGA